MICTCQYKTPQGFDDMWMSSDGDVLTGLWFEGSRGPSKHRLDCVERDLPVFRETRRWLDIYFSGHQPDFTPRYRMDNLTGAPLDHYLGKLAAALAKKHGIAKMSAQAVGGAVGWNPICIIVPCHRVVGAGNSLTGYGGGITNKARLLSLEGLVAATEFVV